MSGRRSGVKIITRGVYTKAKSLEDEKRRQSGNGNSTSRYKTELCRPFQEYGYCKYSDKCQFAHGEHELRALPRHPKYKTELCRTYHSKGFCPYGPRCHFVHNLEEMRKSDSSGPKSPKKTTGFNLPISPSQDSGISSPDDLSGYAGNKTFEFPTIEGSRSDESDREPDQQFFFYQNRTAHEGLYSTENGFGITDQKTFSANDGTKSVESEPDHQDSYYPTSLGRTLDDISGPNIHVNGFVVGAADQREEIPSPDPFLEFDVLSSGSGSPAKPISNGFSSDQDLREIFMGMSLDDSSSVSRSSSGHRLPVFDDMLNSKSDTALTVEGIVPSFAI